MVTGDVKDATQFLDAHSFAAQSYLMNSASQSNSDAEAARRLVDDMEQLTKRGWKLAAAMWFPMQCVAVATLASVPAAILLDSDFAMGLYWSIVSPVTAIACGWYFSTRRVQLPDLRGGLVLLTALAMVGSAKLFGWLYHGEWALVAPWLAVGLGLGIFAVALRSFATGAVALVCLTISVIVAVTEPEHGYVLLALTVGVAAALAATVELIRAETVTA